MPDNSGRPAPNWRSWILVWLAFGLAALVLFQQQDVRYKSLTYSHFKELVAKGEIEEAVFDGQEIRGKLRSGISDPNGPTFDRYTTWMPAADDPGLMDRLEQEGVKVRAEAPHTGMGAWIVALLPWVLILGLWYFLSRRMMQRMPGGIGNMLRRKQRKVEKESALPDRFSDVAGQESAKREVSELVDFLRNPERYRRLGAEVPHGILLQGAPGTGKTLLARALAGEAQVPFFHISASEFIKVFVGIGASRVRQLWPALGKVVQFD